jgi:hypothetical protein
MRRYFISNPFTNLRVPKIFNLRTDILQPIGRWSAPGHSRRSRHPGVSGSPQARTFGQCPRVSASSFIPAASSSRTPPPATRPPRRRAA